MNLTAKPESSNNGTPPQEIEAFLPFSVHMEYFSWLDFLGFTLLPLLSFCGTALNGFILWVFGLEQTRSNGDVVQMNLAICDVIDGILGSSLFIASRFVMVSWPMEGFKIFFLALCMNVGAIYFEDWTTMLVTVLRTRQVYSSPVLFVIKGCPRRVFLSVRRTRTGLNHEKP